MNSTFALKKGTLVFKEDKIVITDNARILRSIKLFLSAAMIILVLTSAIAYFTPGDQYEWWLGCFIGLTLFLALVVSPFTSVQGEIDLKEVQSLKMKRGLFGEYLAIKLTNNKTRRVNSIVDKEALREYLDSDSLAKPVFEPNTFELKEGKIVFEESKILITDIAKKQRFQMLLLTASGMLLGSSYLLGYFKKGDQFGLWFGLFIMLGNILMFVVYFLRSVKSEISMNEVKSMKIKKRAGNEFLDIKLHNNRTRRVTEIYNPDRLKNYINSIQPIN
jgi:hypothetical protein